MEVKCALCGRKEEITKVHKDYQKLARDKDAVYTCEICRARLRYQAVQQQKPQRPL
ncbi:DUF2197 domain-containing protein [Neomoorella thermoacetica]|uniref:DUF2197 domain-containing protein n=2 Tax=Neomoorella thermoacetica TaxID=1525 RepID=A0A1D7X9M2_NEOTH|nr:DUF2197 domain-containing protein [Moorella thermoacetica]AKX93682.1 hypothetical protein MOTHE_c08800 [Moorella thermoacetica]AKX96324.1 hypothetical protein MOTHA_c09690 [Moorella thermoacetica]AOQ23592.1 hypothetical protein Maut_01140 [Moorella thermoacetica]APC08046.1 hypothetical protein MTJW_08780 [Moorella thermoacetica]OIQ09669.1 hypothetical protein MOOR_05090 [Moorella thermoacetica]